MATKHRWDKHGGGNHNFSSRQRAILIKDRSCVETLRWLDEMLEDLSPMWKTENEEEIGRRETRLYSQGGAKSGGALRVMLKIWGLFQRLMESYGFLWWSNLHIETILVQKKDFIKNMCVYLIHSCIYIDYVWKIYNKSVNVVAHRKESLETREWPNTDTFHCMHCWACLPLFFFLRYSYLVFIFKKYQVNCFQWILCPPHGEKNQRQGRGRGDEAGAAVAWLLMGQEQVTCGWSSYPSPPP